MTTWGEPKFDKTFANGPAFGWKSGEVARDMRPALFAAQTVIDGFVVIATDTGRQVTASYPFEWEATAAAEALDRAAEDGPKSLAKALAAA